MLRQNPSELSGVRPRRDSVIGMRLTPPPRATRSELPGWFWGALGCLSVLLVGFVGLFVLGRAGKLGPLLGEGSPLAAVVQAPATPAPAVEVAPIAAAPAPTEPVAKAPVSHERVEREHERAAAERAAAEVAAPAAPAPADTPPTDPSAVAPAPAPTSPTPAAPTTDDGAGAAKQPVRVAAATPAATKVRAAKSGDAPAAADPADQGDNAGDSTDTKAAPARPTNPTKASPKSNAAAADDSDDDSSLPGQDAVEAALDKLSTQVRGCFVKYQIKGTARVRLVATPAGTAESVNVTGDFEDTPTGLCVESVIGGAKLPAFKGAPLKLSQSYQLR